MDAPIRGHLGRDPELIETPSGKSVVRLRIAQDTPEGRTPFWFDAEAWGDLAIRISQTLRSGDPVAGTGRWDRSEWTDKETGSVRSKNFVKVVGLGPDLSRVALRGELVKPSRARQSDSPAPDAASNVPADPMDED